MQPARMLLARRLPNPVGQREVMASGGRSAEGCERVVAGPHRRTKKAPPVIGEASGDSSGASTA